MKKIYLSILSITLISAFSTAQILDDNLDSYTAGVPVGTQTGNFVPWGGDAAVDPIVSAAFSSSPSNSLLITNDGDDDDTVMQLGDQLGGQYTLSYSIYTPDGKSSFFGILQTQDVNDPQFTTNIYTNYQGTGIDYISQDGILDTAEGNWFNLDAWNTVVMLIDLDVDTIIINVNGNEIFNGIYFGNGSFALGAVDLWCPDSATCEAYFDDFLFVEGFLSTQDFAATGFRSALNNDILTLRANEEISNVSIYNMLGQEIYRSSTNTSSINMSSYANGTYIVKVNIAGIEGTVKVVK